MATTNTTRGSLAQVLVPQATLTKDLGLVAAGATLTAVCSQISIPWEPVPFTLQTMAVALCGLTLGARRGALSQVAYLAAGCAGAPVFANFQGGAHRLFGPTGGFLVAFVLVAWMLGTLADKGYSRSAWKLSAGLVAANAVTLGLGALWLGALIGMKAAIATGVVPFVGSELVKDVAVVLALPAAWVGVNALKK